MSVVPAEQLERVMQERLLPELEETFRSLVDLSLANESIDDHAEIVNRALLEIYDATERCRDYWATPVGN